MIERNNMEKETAPNFIHPMAYDAMNYIQELGLTKLMRYKESFASAALTGNEISEILLETLRRIMEGEKVSDRYLLGLAWFIKNSENKSC